MKYLEIISQSPEEVKNLATKNRVARAEIAMKNAQITTSEKLEEAKEVVQKILRATPFEPDALYKAEQDVAVYEKRLKWTEEKLKDLF